ncbi:MAG: transcription termination factor Rho [Planctomycetes bacterium]|nr:transcription termination factor Rho [Planctomycetota bacterium]
MAPKDPTQTTEPVPFGAMQRPPAKVAVRDDPGGASDEARGGRDKAEGGGKKDYRAPEKRRGNSRRGGRRRRKKTQSGEGEAGVTEDDVAAPQAPQTPRAEDGEAPRSRRRRGRRKGRGGDGGEGGAPAAPREREGEPSSSEALVGSGMFMTEKGGYGTLRREEAQYLASKQDIFVPQRLIQKYRLRDGSIVEGPISRGKKHKFQLDEVRSIDDRDPKAVANVRQFKKLITIDPDFHYAVGDVTGEVSMRVLDIVAPVGRGQRGLVVAQPRTGKTTLMRQFAKGIELGYPDVHLFVLLVDERPEEATDWIRSTKGKVFVSTSDESPKNHVQLAEAVWQRCQRLVELGEDVVLIMDSITRLARAYNNNSGGSGRTMSGGLDSRAMERPRQIFGSARNTENAGSLTILATALIDTGSRMDQLIFEEFKGTGNMEVMLNRKLADRRIFPAIDIEKSGTRKEEKLLTSRKLRRVNTLRRVLLKMNFVEAMELLVTKLDDVEKTDDFLARFDVDPEA